MTEEEKKPDVQIKYDGEDPSFTQIVSRRFKKEASDCLFSCGILSICLFIAVVIFFFLLIAAGPK